MAHLYLQNGTINVRMRLFSGLGLNLVVGKMRVLLDLLSPVDALLGHSGWPPGNLICILFIAFLTAKHVCYHVLGPGRWFFSSSLRPTCSHPTICSRLSLGDMVKLPKAKLSSRDATDAVIGSNPIICATYIFVLPNPAIHKIE